MESTVGIELRRERGERFCVSGKPSKIYCTSYSEPRGWSIPFAS